MEEPELEEDRGYRAERGFPDPRKDRDWKGIRGAGDRLGEGEGEGASGQRRRRGERAGSKGGAGVGQDRASPRGADCSCLRDLLTEWAAVARLG